MKKLFVKILSYNYKNIEYKGYDGKIKSISIDKVDKIIFDPDINSNKNKIFLIDGKKLYHNIFN